jgi:type VI secretion system secreted protein VgrG
LTLDAQANPDAVFIFKIGTTLITGSNSKVVLTNGAGQCNVFWQVGRSATLGTGTQFVGNILAMTSITLETNAVLSGRALAENGAVTLDSNTVSVPTCAGPVSCSTHTEQELFAGDYRRGSQFYAHPHSQQYRQQRR